MTVTRKFVTLDANATEPLRPEAREAVLAAWAIGGNPSSVHGGGRRARAVLETARTELATLFGATPDNVVFTSGGTEACALAIHGLGRAGPVLAGATEHDAVLRAVPQPLTVPVDGRGVIDLAALDAALAAHRPTLVCMMLANNETGVLHPIAEVAALCRAHDARLHVDAVQAAGRLFPTLDTLGADSMALSAHKFGGPKGIGALLLRGDRARPLPPLVAGGGQEQGRRGGTQAFELASGMATAARAARAADQTAIARLRDRFEDAARDAGAVVCGAGADRLPNTCCVALPGVASQTQLIALDIAGLGVSAGSACSSGKVARSHVLAAMGLGALAGEAIRVSLPWSVDDAMVEHAIGAYRTMAQRLARRAA
ncbi:cysteine desulfurase [Ameyamaea chiangmaiensis NBRC 103196]|nr:aminotransferase class V-fold PLP-dependent enzyme [Ameyamaea chiangmaiensis]MBS4075079.1 aminotransferase class V-fold PLP-dependent enzyme [Ameyamaea chiangmaiensis]GBQ65543.1 cysteine desulfurase [Ameyamaea chiangmaiensis NBRC 103196]